MRPWWGYLFPWLWRRDQASEQAYRAALAAGYAALAAVDSYERGDLAVDELVALLDEDIPTITDAAQRL